MIQELQLGPVSVNGHPVAGFFLKKVHKRCIKVKTLGVMILNAVEGQKKKTALLSG
jgi:hypothetical protein